MGWTSPKKMHSSNAQELATIELIKSQLDSVTQAHKSLLEENQKLRDNKQLEESNRNWMLFQGADKELSLFKAFLDYYQTSFGKSVAAQSGSYFYSPVTVHRYRDSEAFDKALQAWEEMKDLDLID